MVIERKFNQTLEENQLLISIAWYEELGSFFQTRQFTFTLHHDEVMCQIDDQNTGFSSKFKIYESSIDISYNYAVINELIKIIKKSKVFLMCLHEIIQITIITKSTTKPEIQDILNYFRECLKI